MSNTRKFLKHPEKLQICYLVHVLSIAMKEHPEICSGSYAHNHHTDLIGIACQFGKIYGIKREDFNKLSDLTFGELINSFNENYKKIKL